MLTIVLKDETVSTCGRAHGGALTQHEADRLSPSKVIIFSSYTFGADWRYLQCAIQETAEKPGYRSLERGAAEATSAVARAQRRGPPPGRR